MNSMKTRHLALVALATTVLLGAACASTSSGATASDAGATKPTGPKVMTKEVSYQGEDGVTLKGFIAWDANATGPRPGVLVVHEWWGHNDYARKRATMLAELGYTALAVDMYGDGKTAGHPKDAQKFMMAVFSKAGAAKARFLAAHALLKDHDTVKGGKVAAIGYCFGGAVVLNMARAGLPLAGVVSFHGSLATKTPAQPGTIKGQVLVLNGAADPMVKPEHITGFKEEMRKAGVTFDFVNYDGAKHAFTNPGATEKGQKFGLPLAYDAKADKDSWKRMKGFLGTVLAK